MAVSAESRAFMNCKNLLAEQLSGGVDRLLMELYSLELVSRAEKQQREFTALGYGPLDKINALLNIVEARISQSEKAFHTFRSVLLREPVYEGVVKTLDATLREAREKAPKDDDHEPEQPAQQHAQGGTGDPKPKQPAQQPTQGGAAGRTATDSSTPTTSSITKFQSDFKIIKEPPNSAFLREGPADESYQTAFAVTYRGWKGMEAIHQHILSDEKYLRGSGTCIAILDNGINTRHYAFESPPPGEQKLSVVDHMKDGILQIDSHGTMCAGIAAGRRYAITDKLNFPGGVAPDAKVQMHRIGPRLEKTIAALSSLKEHQKRVDVISMSISLPCTDETWKRDYEPHITALVTGNWPTICVAAASNVGATTKKGEGVSYPARDENVLAIGAHDELGNKTGFTPPEWEVDFLALGQNVWAPSNTDNQQLVSTQGTSMATPAIAGLICLIIQLARDLKKNPLYHPTLPQITDILRRLTRDPKRGKREGEGYGPLVIGSFSNFKTAVEEGLKIQLPP